MSCFLTFQDYWYPTLGDPRYGVQAHCEGFDRVWHLVRHPLRVIASMRANGGLPGHILHWQERHTGIPGNYEPMLGKHARIWCAWTRAADLRASRTIRVEDTPGVWEELLAELGKPLVPGVLEGLGTRTGSIGPEPLSWDELRQDDEEAYREVLSLAQKHGYDNDDPS